MASFVVARRRTRLKLTLPMEVFGRDSVQEEWAESAKLIEASPIGARFLMSHPVEPGCLLRLQIPLPRHMRFYDQQESAYRVWSVVRYVGAPMLRFGKCVRSVGVAFVGKRAPASFELTIRRRATTYCLPPTACGTCASSLYARGFRPAKFAAIRAFTCQSA